MRTTLEIPDHFAAEYLKELRPTQWFFSRQNESQVAALLQSCQLSPPDLAILLNRTNWQKAEDGIFILPPESVVLNLPAEARAKIYSVLRQSPKNGLHSTPYVFRLELLRLRFERCGLSEKTISLFQRLLYPHGSLMLFSDMPALASQVTDTKERVRLIKTISRRETMLIKLAIEPDSDIDALLAYWGVAGRAKDLRPLLESLTRVQGGWELDIAHLLPGFPRQKIYTYPSPQNSSLPAENCHWTSFNFFNNPPDDGLRQWKNVQKELEERYDVVTGTQKRLGDVILLVDSHSAVVHSAVHIADDIVFTKNGGRENQPWIFMKLEDMLPFYQHQDNPVHVEVCRRKDLK